MCTWLVHQLALFVLSWVVHLEWLGVEFEDKLIDLADAKMDHNLEPQMGKVQVYTIHADPTLTKPDMVLKHKVTPKLKPILKALAQGYSPVCSK